MNNFYFKFNFLSDLTANEKLAIVSSLLLRFSISSSAKFFACIAFLNSDDSNVETFGFLKMQKLELCRIIAKQNVLITCITSREDYYTPQTRLTAPLQQIPSMAAFSVQMVRILQQQLGFQSWNQIFESVILILAKRYQIINTCKDKIKPYSVNSFLWKIQTGNNI